MRAKNAKVKILLVDNNEEYRSTVRESLEDAGYEVVEASHPKQALGIVHSKNHGISLAIIDIRLIDDDDREDHSGLKLIRNLPSNLSVIVLTAHEDARVVRAAFRPAPGQEEPKGYLFKGDGLNAIKECVERVVSKSDPTSQPWYREPTFFYLAIVTIVLMIGGGIYIEYVSQGNQVLGVIMIGVVIDILAGLLLNFLKIGN